MAEFELPAERIVSTAFKERGRDDVVKIEAFSIADGDLLKVVFESRQSPWRQGVWMKTDDHLVVNQQQATGLVLWQDTAPAEVLVECHSYNGCLHLYNVWDRGRGMESQSWTSGMLIEEIAHGRRYRCNDIGFDTDFRRLVFRLERTSDSSGRL